MHMYKTVKEKSVEWNLSARHVQFLCRNGKIDGAIKRAEAWFIPGDAPSPAIKTKSNSKDINFVGTKRKIFYSAIQLFMLNGFDNVSLKEIGDQVGIRQSTIYNHFKSKQEILDAIYDFFVYYYLENRPSMEEMNAKLQDKSLTEIIDSIRYEFKVDYLQAMTDITKIIFQRIGIADRAKTITKSLILDQGIQYVEDVFNMGIEKGRFAPFNTHIMAIFINSVRIFTLYVWILDLLPQDMMKIFEAEKKLYEYAGSFIKDLFRDEMH